MIEYFTNLKAQQTVGLFKNTPEAMLPNGNTLICEGVGGRFFEIDDRDSIVWQYINPVGNNGPMLQGETTTGAFNNVFRCVKYSIDYPAFIGRDLSPKGNIESGSTYTCEIYEETTTTGLVERNPRILMFYPNPARDLIYLDWQEATDQEDLRSICIVDVLGKVCYRQEKYTEQISVQHVESGLYFLRVNMAGSIFSYPMVVSH